METMQTIKSLLARLAGVPPRAAAPHPPPRPVQRSTLYAPPVVSAAALSAVPPVTSAALSPPALSPPSPQPAPPSIVRTSRQRDGDDGELLARRHLERAGLTFVAANVRYRDGEIDLVMRDRPRVSQATPSLVFIEVRRRARTDHGGAGGSVTPEKRRRIVAAAAHYLVGLGLRTLPPCRFDVVTLDGDAQSGLRIAWLRDAFRDEG